MTARKNDGQRGGRERREEQVVVGDMCVRLRPLEKSTNLKILLRTTFTYTHQTLDADGARASLENLMEGT